MNQVYDFGMQAKTDFWHTIVREFMPKNSIGFLQLRPPPRKLKFQFQWSKKSLLIWVGWVWWVGCVCVVKIIGHQGNLTLGVAKTKRI